MNSPTSLFLHRFRDEIIAGFESATAEERFERDDEFLAFIAHVTWAVHCDSIEDEFTAEMLACLKIDFNAVAREILPQLQTMNPS